MTPSQTTLNPAMKGCDAMFPALTDTFGSSAPAIRSSTFNAVGKYCTGTHHINAGVARDMVSVAADTPDVTSESKAETTMKLMLMAGRKLSGKTLGLIGFGRAGRETAHRAHFGFGMKIVVHNHSAVPDEDLDPFNAEQAKDIDDLLGRSDFVSLHCPPDPENRHLIDALRLNKMKPDAYLINTACSELVDEEALADALWYDTIAGAAFDMIHNQPGVCDRLVACENVVLPPLKVSTNSNLHQTA